MMKVTKADITKSEEVTLYYKKSIKLYCHRLTIFHSFCTQKMTKLSYFSYENVRLALIPL